MSESRPAAPHRFVLLDGLRGVAALLVVLFHAARDGSPFYKLDPLFLMVDFFFVLSGFVLLPSMPKAWRTFGRDSYVFIVKRIFRLWPMLIAVMLTSVAVYHFEMWDTHRTGAGFNYDVNRNGHMYLMAMLLMQIWVSKSMMMVVPLWSLSAEWFANLVYTFLTPLWKVVGLAVGVVVGYHYFRQGLKHDTEWIGWIGPIRGDEAFGRALIGFGLGGLMRVLADWIGPRVFARWYVNLPLFALSIYASWRLLDEYRNLGYAIINYAGPVFAFVVFTASYVKIPHSSVLGRVLLKLGAWSFGIYAFHRIFMDLFNYYSDKTRSWWHTPIYMAPNQVWFKYVELKMGVVTLASVAATIVAGYLVERPLQRLGRRLTRFPQGHERR